MNHPIQCRCGTVKGYVSHPEKANHCVCYCKDCQAFAHFLGAADDILDDRGGSEIMQTLPRYVSFSEGADRLACMRLTDNGLLRWYTRCCNTPIGNTLANYKLSFIGLVHNCLEYGGKSPEASFGPVRMWGYTQSAKGEPKPASRGLVAGIFRIMGMLAKARFTGNYRQTPFFDVNTGQPVAVPKVLSREEREQVMNAL